MKILALDTSSNACSVALIEGRQQNYTCIERFQIAPRQHTQLILPMIDAVLNEAAYDINDIDLLAFGRGPGAFTGVRVATGVVQAIAYGADLPVAEISSLAALAQGAYQAQIDDADTPVLKTKVLVASDARMGEIYFAAYEMREGFMILSGSEYVIKPEQLGTSIKESITWDKHWLLIGNGWPAYAQQLEAITSQCTPLACSTEIIEKLAYPEAKHIAYLAFREMENNTLVRAEQVSPVYLRNNIAKKPQKLA